MVESYFLPSLPENLKPLIDLALNLRRSSTAIADELWSLTDKEMWERTKNPWLILQTLKEETIESLSQDAHFLSVLTDHLKKVEALHATPTWFSSLKTDLSLSVVYFSMEFGLSEALPIYSGGLGILAGDHLKAASDLGIPLTAIGLLYGQGYFRQEISPEGIQTELYPFNNPSELPVTPLLDNQGEWIRFSLDFPERKIWVRAWKARVGRIQLFLLDTNDPMNTPADRGVTSELYGGDVKTRLEQEILLGMGGWKLVKLLGINPTVCHLNEGHAAFVILAQTHEMMQTHQVDFVTGFLMVRAGNLFTTHTPVSAGFDRFSDELLKRFFGDYISSLGISMEEFLALGKSSPSEAFNMAVLAIRGSTAINGVSKLHAKVSQTLFHPLFPDRAEEDVPVDSVTNGVHVPSWESIEADALWEAACGSSRWMGTMPEVEKEIHAIPSETLWQFRQDSRKRLIDYVHKKDGHSLDPHVLTIGFSRRFATYKRVDLLLKDPQRLIKLLTSSEYPLQIVIAGKAHPHDEDGKALVRKWQDFLKREEVAGKVIFLSDYDMLLAERMVQGMDVWINTPRRPWEASGTSGMKLLVNGGLNCSELDGWWAEAYRSEVGWALGDRKEHVDEEEWDHAEAETLYSLLENEILPLFYARDAQGIPQKWLEKIRESMALLTMEFSTNRMIREYTEKFYLPLCENKHKRTLEQARTLQEQLGANLDKVQCIDQRRT